jgi:hypothetical protein
MSPYLFLLATPTPILAPDQHLDQTDLAHPVPLLQANRPTDPPDPPLSLSLYLFLMNPVHPAVDLDDPGTLQPLHLLLPVSDRPVTQVVADHPRSHSLNVKK